MYIIYIYRIDRHEKWYKNMLFMKGRKNGSKKRSG
jgi:hypothetical protein